VHLDEYNVPADRLRHDLDEFAHELLTQAFGEVRVV